VSIRDLPRILEALGEHAGRTKNAALLTECARKALARTITGQHKKSDGKIYAITLDPALEHPLLSCVQQGPDAITLSIPPEAASQINQAAAQCWKAAMDKGLDDVALLCDARIRPGMMNLIGRSLQRLPVIAYDEICTGTQVELVEMITLPDAALILGQAAEMVSTG
jgi:flagellar biosynthesis protein FlhA